MNDLTTLQTLINKINTIHTSVQQETLKSVSKNLVLRNWLIGYYIVEYEQNGEDRAKYGDRLIENISKNLSHIKGMSKSNLHSFKQFYLYYPQISQTVSGKFNLQNKKFQTVSGKSIEISIGKLLQVSTFSHFIEYMRLDSDLKRAFYEIETIKGNWSVRELKRQINSQTYERIGLSIDKKQMIDTIQNSSENLLPMQIIKDPYILEFTGLEQKAKYSENDLESSLLNHLQDFLLELGNGFCFEARQKRISIDNEHDRVDLVFYHRILKYKINLPSIEEIEEFLEDEMDGFDE